MLLASNFDMKDLGEANVILGIKITKTSDGLILSQEHYVENLLRRVRYYYCKTVSTLYDSNTHLKKNIEYCVDQARYAQLISSLMYLINSTRSDIAFAVGRLSRYTQNRNQDHWTAVAKVARYLRGTNDYWLKYSISPLVLEGYSDAN